ncbi:DEAD/DEAH box helicase domain-containing protein [Besnoitia besnoiti]|uniref:DEAD/DEAH box helicase domain-containing protein n=1 Tax=Besnoitia besnoiti TaxID=94643 RepID=A0A2A9MLU7_BESBE|nr:DEAD/DEAH box helicase domain-containing protein [Besnoitia besnoiti]PFH36713.1 DEAD/DEAH box helicase domain-containing protein [Besnoitia besnoiti]
MASALSSLVASGGRARLRVGILSAQGALPTATCFPAGTLHRGSLEHDARLADAVRAPQLTFADAKLDCGASCCGVFAQPPLPTAPASSAAASSDRVFRDHTRDSPTAWTACMRLERRGVRLLRRARLREGNRRGAESRAAPPEELRARARRALQDSQASATAAASPSGEIEGASPAGLRQWEEPFFDSASPRSVSLRSGEDVGEEEGGGVAGELRVAKEGFPPAPLPPELPFEGRIPFSCLEDAPKEARQAASRGAGGPGSAAQAAAASAEALDACVLSQFSALHRALLVPLLKGGGIVTPTDIQERCIPTLLAGRSSLLVAPTGSGKTLAWALPLLHRLLATDSERLAPHPQQPRLVVLVPSRELALQVLTQLRQFSAAVTSGACTAGQSYVKEVRMLRSGVDVVVATPARLLLHLHKKNVNMRRVQALVVEEADTLCDAFYEQELCALLGNHFPRLRAPALDPGGAGLQTPGVAGGTGLKTPGSPASRARQNLLEMRDAPRGGLAGEPATPEAASRANELQMVFVAATKTGALGRFLKHQLGRVHISSVCTPDAHLAAAGVQQVFVSLHGQDRMSRLLEVLEENVGGTQDAKTMIFCNTVNTCRAVDLTLLEKGYRVSCLHGLMPFKLRKASFQKLKKGETNILVCTNVASRGLDVEGVQHVIHFDFPQTLADYLHRSGRTARGGETGRVTLLFSKRNLPLIQQIQNASRAATSPAELRHATPRIRRILRLEERWKELLDMRNPKRKIGGRKKLGLPPNRNTVGPKAKWAIKKLYFRMKARGHLQFLRSRGVLGKKELLPRHPRASVERSDAQQAMKMIRGDDGLLQVLPVRRSKSFMLREAQKREEGHYESPETTSTIEGGKTFESQRAAKPAKHSRRTYF